MDKKRSKIGLNKVIFLLIFIYFLLGIGVTYAYFAFSYENTSTIVGNVVNIDATLTVERVVGTDKKLVPMVDDALSNALIGSENGACIDSLGNLSCQVYKITLTNNASRLQHLVGTIELYPKDGTENSYSNLKWRELTDIKTVKSESIVNGMNKSILVSGLTLDSKQSKNWYIGVWLSEINSNQANIDKGEFGGEIKFEVIDGINSGTVGSFYNDFVEKIMISNATSDKNINFRNTSEQSNTNGIYLRDETENNSFPIYYYRGNVNNNLIFAGFCWKVVRTTETGGLKLIYNGIPTDGICNNTDTYSQIGRIAFNSNSNSLAYVGYMYGDVYTYSTKDFSSDTTAYIYGNGVSYESGTYTLTGATISGQWSNIYSNLSNTHYTCFTTGNICTKVYYIYYTNSSVANYITLNKEANIEEALSNMLDYNTKSSIIKGNNQTSGTLDYWYYHNIETKGYKDYIEDTVWCNDRSISALHGWNPNGGDTTKYIYFGAKDRAYATYIPILTCARNIDKFTTSTKNGNGALNYPVGLLTLDEIMLAGGTYNLENSSYYLYTNQDYWTISSFYFTDDISHNFNVKSTGALKTSPTDAHNGIRPSISLKYGFKLVDNDADGTVEKPYVVE